MSAPRIGGVGGGVGRALVHHWRMSLAVAAGAAVATAVLTGALVVGDSVRGSLRQLTLERLGATDLAMAARRFVDARLADEVAAAPGVAAVAPAIFLEGAAEHATSGARAAGVGLHGIDARFLAFFPGDAAAIDLDTAAGPFPPLWLNAALAGELGAAPGDDVVLSLERWTAVPRGSLLSRKGTGDVVQRIRGRVAGVLADEGIGRFSLESHQATPRVAFLRLTDLQRQLRQGGTINGLVVDAAPENGADGADAAALDARLRRALRPADLGLELTEHETYLLVESEELVIGPELAATIEEVARQAGATATPILTYIANRIAVAGGDAARSVPYSTLSALPLPPTAAVGALVAAEDQGAVAAPGDDEIVLDALTAGELGAAPGDVIELEYFEVGPREELHETTARLRLAGVVAKEGLAADRELAQDVPGVADAANMADWDPPFPIDLGRVRSSDEAYWDTYRAAPRGFVPLATGQRLWRTRWGQVTSFRLVPGDGDVAALAATVAREVPARASLAAAGLGFQPVRERGLAGSAGSSDFGGLFVGLSFFLIAAAALVAALLFRLGVERRAGEIGLLLAVGHPPRRVRRRLLAEGLTLAAAGAALGLVGAVGYATAVMAALRTWWRPAVGTSRLALHVEPATLAIGAVAALLVVAAAIAWTLRRIGRVPATTLLRGDLEPRATGPGRGARWTAVVCLVAAGVVLAVALLGGRRDDPALFFAVGPLVLAGGLALFALALGRGADLAAGGRLASVARLAVGNAGRQRGRSLLAATLVATAAFLVVAVASYQEDLSRRELGRDSGTGGFALVAESEVPLLHDLEDPEGRLDLGLGDEATERLAGVDVVPLRRLPGDDTSCLNLYRPEQPELLGVTPELVRRGGFGFHATLVPTDDPWTLLLDDGEPADGDDATVPMVGDVNSTQWILKLGLGDTLEVPDELGGTMRLRLVATLDTSIFQGELLVPEAALLRHFPSRAGYAAFLLDVPPEGDPREVARALEADLAPYGFDAESAAERLASFHTVQNTYLQTFLVLGGLGLLLGTVGLAIVQARNVVERRGELATLRAFGFRRGTLRRMVATENAVLLVAGLGIGTVAALLAVLPHLVAPAAEVPWTLLALVLAAVLGFGLVMGGAVAALALSAPLVPTLKAER